MSHYMFYKNGHWENNLWWWLCCFNEYVHELNMKLRWLTPYESKFTQFANKFFPRLLITIKIAQDLQNRYNIWQNISDFFFRICFFWFHIGNLKIISTLVILICFTSFSSCIMIQLTLEHAIKITYLNIIPHASRNVGY